jgi:polar amino acid transport system permease protein
MAYSPTVRAMKHSSQKFKITWLDIVVVTALLVFAAYTVNQINSQLVYNWDWQQLMSYFVKYDEKADEWLPNLLVEGLLITLRVSIWGAIAGLALGLFMGICRVSNVAFFKMLSRGYVELVRNMAPVPFLFIMFFFVGNQLLKPLDLPTLMQSVSPGTRETVEWLFGDVNLLRNFAAAVVALAIYEGAYITEIVRAGIQSIERGQWEAGYSIGLTRVSVLRKIVLPQAFQRVAPPLANQSIQLIKDSSLVSLVSIQELTFMGQEIAHSTSRFFETWLIIAGIYFVVCFGLSRLYARLERRLNKGQH